MVRKDTVYQDSEYVRLLPEMPEEYRVAEGGLTHCWKPHDVGRTVRLLSVPLARHILVDAATGEDVEIEAAVTQWIAAHDEPLGGLLRALGALVRERVLGADDDTTQGQLALEWPSPVASRGHIKWLAEDAATVRKAVAAQAMSS